MQTEKFPPQTHRLHAILSENLYEDVQSLARQERRSVSAQVAIILERYVRESQKEPTP